MSDPNCTEVRRRIALGEAIGVTPHLERCPGCQSDAARTHALLGALTAGAALSPPVTLDERVRRLIAGTNPAPKSVLSPAPALALAALWVAGIAVTLTFVLSATWLGERAPAIALFLVVGFLVISAAAMLPLLLLRPSRMSARELEVIR